MPAIFASAPGKVILLGEHAVVYNRPAIAVPIMEVYAKAIITPNPKLATGIVQIQAPKINLDTRLSELPDGHALKEAINLVFSSFDIDVPPSLTVRITSTIPVASGLGSGAAVSVAIIKALSAFLGKPFSKEKVSELAFQVERIHHGTPSGIDNTVITYETPVYFVRNQPMQFLTVSKPLCIVIGDTGIQSPTASVVGDVRRIWNLDRDRCETIFDQIGTVAQLGKSGIENGDMASLGQLMTRNHALLQELTVSSPQLDRLVDAAIQAGALGAKLSGGGRGGNMIALADEASSSKVARHLQEMGAVRTIVTIVGQKV